MATAESASSKAEAEARIAQALDALAQDDQVQTAIWRANLKANMAGELFVREIELHRALFKLEAEGPTFLSLPFDEAIEHFLSRVVMDPEAFAELSDTERFRSFTVARVLSDRLRERMFDRLGSAVENDFGPGLRDFVQEFEQDVLSGDGGSVRSYLENVYRTNTATSYNAGRFRAQTDPDVVEATGYWQYVTAGDNRVRPAHRALDGKQWRIGDPQAQQLYPPNGYMCRCAIVVIDSEDVDQRQLNREVGDDAITTGFGGTPVLSIQSEAGTA